MNNKEIMCAYWGMYKNDEPFEFGIRSPKKISKGDIIIVSYPTSGIVDKNMDIYTISFADKPLPGYVFPDDISYKINGNMLNKMFDLIPIESADTKSEAKGLFK